jgi:ABC-type multidrug transport system fused ATPase/permease subunit
LYLGGYAGLGIGNSIGILVVTLFSSATAVTASRALHSKMMLAVLRSPMSFFDTTPLGRIVNRFSKDVYALDETIPRSLRSFLTTFLQVCCVYLCLCVCACMCVCVRACVHVCVCVCVCVCCCCCPDACGCTCLLAVVGRLLFLPPHTRSQVVSIIVVITYSTPIFMAAVAPLGLLYYWIQRYYGVCV